jgi:3-dehydroquinate dehydratase/shikimate dehydrogenase
MIAISVCQHSQQLTWMEIEAAALQGDLIELRLDRLRQSPDFAQLLGSKRPMIVSCRRKQDGGHWDRSEELRIEMLRRGAEAGAAYVEIECDAAARLPRCGAAKRIVSTTLAEPDAATCGEIGRRAAELDADVIRVAAAPATLQSAWPLLLMLTQQKLPTVLAASGPTAITLALLAARCGSPWTYAARHAGAETYPQQPTQHDLVEIYRLATISPTTPLVGVTESSPLQSALSGMLNAAFALLELPHRCLPLDRGDLASLARGIEVFGMVGLIVGPAHRLSAFEELVLGPVLPLPKSAPVSDERTEKLLHDTAEVARQTRQAEFVRPWNGQWIPCDVGWRAAVKAVGAHLPRPTGSKRLFEGRAVLLLGSSPLARALAQGLLKERARLRVCGADDSWVRPLAADRDARPVSVEQLASLDCSVIIATEPGPGAAGRWPGVDPLLRPGVVVLDVGQFPHDTDMARRAAARECTVVDPLDMWFEQVDHYVRMLAGRRVPRRKLAGMVSGAEILARLTRPAIRSEGGPSSQGAGLSPGASGKDSPDRGPNGHVFASEAIAAAEPAVHHRGPAERVAAPLPPAEPVRERTPAGPPVPDGRDVALPDLPDVESLPSLPDVDVVPAPPPWESAVAFPETASNDVAASRQHAADLFRDAAGLPAPPPMRELAGLVPLDDDERPRAQRRREFVEPPPEGAGYAVQPGPPAPPPRPTWWLVRIGSVTINWPQAVYTLFLLAAVGLLAKWVWAMLHDG